MNIKECALAGAQIKENINRVIIGKSKVIDFVLTALVAGGHVLLEDVPGTGKTVMAKSLARSVDADFARVQFTPDLMPTDVTGLYFYNQKEAAFTLRKGPVFTNLLLADEINRATPRTQSALLECMEERQVTIDGITHRLEAPFFVIATENPVENAGTFPLPEAQLDRFFMKLSMGLPDEADELSILNRFISASPLAELEAVCTKETLLELQRMVPEIYVHPSLLQYMVDIAQETRKVHGIVSGVSPRGTLALLKGSQAYALLAGREYVVPEDIKALAEPVLAHRMILGQVAGSGSSARQLIGRILEQVPVPTEDAFSGKDA